MKTQIIHHEITYALNVARLVTAVRSALPSMPEGDRAPLEAALENFKH